MRELRKPPFPPDIPSFRPRGRLKPRDRGSIRTAILTPPGDRSSTTPFCSLGSEGGSLQEDDQRGAHATVEVSEPQGR